MARHMLVLTIETESLISDLVCPHEGKSFDDDEAPDCYLLYNGASAGACLVREAYGAYGDDCLQADKPFVVEQYPIPVTYRFEADELYVTPIKED